MAGEQEPFVSRGFERRRRSDEELADRVPPGQYVENGFPVLTAGPTPRSEPRSGAFASTAWSPRSGSGAGRSFTQLPFEEVPCDIHCVTSWSKLGTSFRGVSMDTLLEAAEPLEAYAMAYSYGGYTTNLAIEDLTDGRAWVVTEHEGEPLPREHGGPGSAARPAPLLLEERQVDRGPTRDGPRRARLLGGERLPQPRRSLEGGALLDGLTAVEQRAPGKWQLATVTGIKRETPSVKSFRLELPMWMAHCPGQHYVVRLTAPDGYRAQRSYSVASSPLDEGEIELTIDRLDDGEVSTYFHDVLAEGDRVEVRGPFASYFVWRGEAPALLIGGGSGVVPLMAMLRHRRRTMPELPMKLVYSVRSPDDVIYADELGEDALLDLHAAGPGRLGRPQRPHRRRPDRRGGRRALDRLHLRLERVRGERHRAGDGSRHAPRGDPDRALRADRLSGPPPPRARESRV